MISTGPHWGPLDPSVGIIFVDGAGEDCELFPMSDQCLWFFDVMVGLRPFVVFLQPLAYIMMRKSRHPARRKTEQFLSLIDLFIQSNSDNVIIFIGITYSFLAFINTSLQIHIVLQIHNI